MGISNPGASLPALANFPSGAAVYGIVEALAGAAALVQPPAGTTWAILDMGNAMDVGYAAPNITMTNGVLSVPVLDMTAMLTNDLLGPEQRRYVVFITSTIYLRVTDGANKTAIGYTGYKVK